MSVHFQQLFYCSFINSNVEFLHYLTTFVQSHIKISGSTPRARLTGKRYLMWKPYLIFFHSFKHATSQARVFTYARRCDKDPGSGWSRDSFKNLLLGGVGKVSNYMLPHTSDTFQMQGARCSGCEK